MDTKGDKVICSPLSESLETAIDVDTKRVCKLETYRS